MQLCCFLQYIFDSLFFFIYIPNVSIICISEKTIEFVIVVFNSCTPSREELTKNPNINQTFIVDTSPVCVIDSVLAIDSAPSIGEIS